MTGLATTNLLMVRKPGQQRVAEPVPLGPRFAARASCHT